MECNIISTEEPIYDFDGLKSLLKSKGYRIEKAAGYRPIENKDVDLNELRNNIEFLDDGIFLIDGSNGIRQQIFLYKRDYHLEVYGKPRFHIRKCQTIQSFIESGTFRQKYRRANTEVVKVCDMDDGNIDKDVSNLPLCQYCLGMAVDAYAGMTTTDFVGILRSANEESEEYTRDEDVDIFGYTRNWEQISRAYREKRNYKCERCGLQITNPFDQYYMHVHHKDGNKTNNRETNLECLCIHCHSNVDETHYRRFHEGANAIILHDFERLYIE